jgi:DNA-binding CsgD family transcriptional regulator
VEVGMLRLTVAERELIAERSRAGVPSRQIAREMGKAYRTVHDHVDRLRRRPPRARVRSGRQLCLAEREEVSRALAEGRSVRAIAVELGRSPSTVCREIARNGGPVRYRAGLAEQRAWRQSRRPKATKLAVRHGLRAAVEDRLAGTPRDWPGRRSPKRVATSVSSRIWVPRAPGWGAAAYLLDDDAVVANVRAARTAILDALEEDEPADRAAAFDAAQIAFRRLTETLGKQVLALYERT